MTKVLSYSLLLVLGLALSQLFPGLFDPKEGSVAMAVRLLTMVGLGFIMIQVGFEFDLGQGTGKALRWDYLVAATAAFFPWIFSAIYFVWAMAPQENLLNAQTWKDALLAGRFASPTSAGVLFSMLAAAGLGATWLFRKARVLAIFDDLDTVLLMIPLKALMVGLRWQLGIIVLLMGFMLWFAWKNLNRFHLPQKWYHVLGYATLIALVSEGIHAGSLVLDDSVPIHIEVLLPAFVLGCVIKATHHEVPPAGEIRASGVVSALFMVLVGLNMPSLTRLLGSQEVPWGTVALHVGAITLLSNLGKMFPAFCYRKEASIRERLALSIGMFPRGEVGAGVLVVSLSYGISGMPLLVAMLSLTLNLLLTGVFILIVKRLLGSESTVTA